MSEIEFVGIERGFWLWPYRGIWRLHYNIPTVVTVKAESESDALCKMVAKLRMMTDDVQEGSFLHQLYINAVNWIEGYRQ